MVLDNNEKTIEKCLNSIKGIGKIYFTDISKKGNTKQYLKSFIEIPAISDSVVENKNNLIKNVEEDWMFFINPWEELISGAEEIKNILNLKKENLYKVLILNKEVINKSIRIINKSVKVKFENQIYEEIYSKNAKTLNIFLKENEKNDTEEEQKIKEWLNKEKLKSTPYYYMLCTKLKNKNYIDFIKYAEKYLFIEQNKELPSVIMTHYYLSLINLHIFKNFKKSTENILLCVEKKPDMAEFWCVLGDINFYLKKYQKAIYFYENAITMGKFRQEDDDFSIEIKKYKIYPETMTEKCKISISENNF